MNELIISKIVPQADKHAVVDWLYGNDDNVIGGSTTIDLSSVSFAQRTNAETIKSKLIEEVGTEMFESLLANSSATNNE
jgi:hypothetical protein